MKLWIDDIRPAPKGYVWCKSVNSAIRKIRICEWNAAAYPQDLTLPDSFVEVIDIDHDAGDFAFDGGDYIKLLDWLEEKGYNYPIHIHSMNPVGVENMRRIIRRNKWREV